MSARSSRWLHWFLPEGPDVLALLGRQGEITIQGMQSLVEWTSGDPGAAVAVRQAEHSADDARRELLSALRRALVTPVEPEDLFELSERLDRVLNQAKDLVREAEVLGATSDKAMAEMAHCAAQGVEALVRGFEVLSSDPEAATRAADEAVRRQRAIERAYRAAMSRLVHSNDLREVASRRELYRRCSRIGDAIEHVADRIWYAVVKET